MSLTTQVRAIHSEEQYDAYLDEINSLLGNPDESAQVRLEVLSILVEAYEQEHHEILPPDPIEVIKFVMDQRGLSVKDLEPYIGKRGRVSEVLNRKRPLTIGMIRKLHSGLGIPADLLIGP
jgi:HTH-type transcriptional regulator/antitoxin HigA